MEIRKFRVERFRSITSASLDLSTMTVLVGPNNEGKSNILRAMVLGMDALVGFARTNTGPRYRIRTGLRGAVDFDWDRDFPVGARNGREKTTALEFEFELAGPEIIEFESVIGSKINGNLRVGLSLSQDGTVAFRVIKQRAGGTWTKKSGEIAEFVGRRVDVEYVPAVRTADEAGAVVARLVAQELRTLEADIDYQDALETIRRLQQPKLDEIGASVRETLAHLMPDVRGVEVRLPETRRQVAAARAVEIIVDDGESTALDTKGDGVQSLAALALIRKAAMDRGRARTFVLAVEEPEAHLHPRAVRELRRVLAEIAMDQQVVVTTHSPLLADPLHVERNVIVEASRARTAHKIAEVRDCLGVRLQDNLQSAQLAVVVEGASDVRIMRAVLAELDGGLADDLEAGVLVIEGLGGGGKLSYRLSQYASGVCGVFVLLDDDASGRASVESSLNDGLLDAAAYRLTASKGKKEAEIEDLIDPRVYLPPLNSDFGVKLSAADVRRGSSKWSRRVASAFADKGKIWNAATEKRAKTIVADAVVDAPAAALLEPDGLVRDVADLLRAKLRGADQ
jgi:putative ATP-dependent endonuclease of the OLD family